MRLKKFDTILLLLMYLFILFFSLTELLPFKVFACLCFLTVAVIGVPWKDYAAKRAPSKYPLVMFFGLLVATMGDIAIFFNAIAGIAIFALGHLLYAVAYYVLYKFHIRDLLCAMGMFLITFILLVFAPFIRFDSQMMQIICLIYGAIISFMAGKALSNRIGVSTLLTNLICYGSIFFYLSDLFVVLTSYATVPGPYRYFGRVLYFGGQYLLALSIASTKNDH